MNQLKADNWKMYKFSWFFPRFYSWIIDLFLKVVIIHNRHIKYCWEKKKPDIQSRPIISMFTYITGTHSWTLPVQWWAMASAVCHSLRPYRVWQLPMTMFNYQWRKPFSLRGQKLVQPLWSEMLPSAFFLLLLLLFLWRKPEWRSVTFIGLGPPSSTSLCWRLRPWFQCSFISETSEPKL